VPGHRGPSRSSSPLARSSPATRRTDPRLGLTVVPVGPVGDPAAHAADQHADRAEPDAQSTSR
jgi:hypothetical protein